MKEKIILCLLALMGIGIFGIIIINLLLWFFWGITHEIFYILIILGILAMIFLGMLFIFIRMYD